MLNGFYLVQNNFQALCQEFLTTLENRLISSMLLIVLYLFLHCSTLFLFYLTQGPGLFVLKSIKMT